MFCLWIFVSQNWYERAFFFIFPNLKIYTSGHFFKNSQIFSGKNLYERALFLNSQIFSDKICTSGHLKTKNIHTFSLNIYMGGHFPPKRAFLGNKCSLKYNCSKSRTPWGNISMLIPTKPRPLSHMSRGEWGRGLH